MALAQQQIYAGESWYEDDDNSHRSILARGHHYVSNWYEYYSPNYNTGRNDEYFLMHSQWNADDLSDLLRLRSPVLTCNKLQDVVKKTVAEVWELDPQIQVRSLDYVASKDDKDLLKMQNMVDLRQNLLRSIAYRSESREAYCHAYDQATKRGYGAFRVDTAYENSYSLHVGPKIIKIDLAEMAFFDPNAIMSHKGDGNVCGFNNIMTKKAFHRLYPEATVSSFYPSYNYPSYFYWGDRDTVTVLDMYEKQFFNKKIYHLEDNRYVDKDKYYELAQAYKRIGRRPPEIIDEGEVPDYHIMHYRMTYNEILEENIFPGKQLPIFFVDCNSYKLDGREYTKSFYHDAIDSQRALNYLQIAIMQYIKNARKEAYIATPAQVSGFEQMWVNPENQMGTLLYNPDPLAPERPSKQPPTEVPQSLYQHYQRISADMQAILGFYDANLGAPTDVISGKALGKKIKQGNLSTLMHRHKLVSAIEQCGKCILSMLPELYDTERTVMLMTPDKKHRNVVINKKMGDGSIENDLTQGNFEVAISVGASYEDQKQEALDTIIQLVTAGGPQLLPLVADIIAQNIDIENRDQLVSRLSTLVPEQIKAKERGEPPPPQPQQPPNPEVMLQIGNLQQKGNELQFKQQQAMQDAQLKMRDQNLEALRLQMEYRNQLSDTQAENLKSFAEVARANADMKTSAHNTLSKLVDLHKTKINKQLRMPM